MPEIGTSSFGMRFAAVTKLWVTACALILAAPIAGIAQNALDGFVDDIVVDGLADPTALAFAPDGRLVVTEQGGTARLVTVGNGGTGIFARLAVDSAGERGLLGIAFHPDFVSNRYVYFYHTVPATASRPAFNRISRFRVSGNAVLPASATTIADLDPLASLRTVHNGGALAFGKDGKLYVGVGDNDMGANAQSLSTRLGKILRYNDNGTIPSTNPTSFRGIAGTTAGANRAIWAVGLRNPYSFAFHPHTGELMINDVGEYTFEELNRGQAGRNYGWPLAEGPVGDPRFTDPLYAYRHGSGAPRGCAITGGTYYSPPEATYPAAYVGKYFFADYCGNWIYSIDPAAPATATLFATGLAAPVGLAVGPDGAIYYLERGQGRLHRIRAVTQARQRMVVTPQEFEMAEGSVTTVAVKLASQPAGEVTVRVDRTLSDYLITSTPGSFLFTPANWNVAQTLTVTAQRDGDTFDESARLSLWASGIPSVRVRVTAVDADRPVDAPRAILSQPRTGDTVSGTRAEFFGDGRGGRTLVRAQFTVDGVVRYTDVNPSGHYHLGGDHNMWNTTLLPDGDHTLRFTVFDADGRSGTHEVRVRVAN